MYSTGLAYLLWLLSGCGALGLHRFYLGKYKSGIAYFFTGGIFMVGSIIDLFNMPSLVERANREKRLDNMEAGYTAPYYVNENPSADYKRPVPKKNETLEHMILKTAQAHRGTITPEQVALEAEKSIEEVRKELDKMTDSGSAQLRVKKNGALVYTISGFTDPNDEGSYEF